MAPEINLGLTYNGTSVDLFATGIILFIMSIGNPPFYDAKINDPFYKLFCSNKIDSFWKLHNKNY